MKKIECEGESNTKKTRLKVYKRALNIVRKKDFQYGMCYAIHEVTGVCNKRSRCHYSDILDIFPEITKQEPPAEKKWGLYWFICDEEGRKQRCKILRNAIKELS